ncbi:MAG: class I SAM-dependent methyltransferase, partial [Prevotella sp.]|nr:class I SAM-dependent methyltransferase [Prevotella sp.]
MAGERLLDQYVLEHSDDEPEYLYRLWRATNVHLLHGRMASGRLQGRLLKMFVEMIRPQHILEIGTFSGYSALCMAEGLANVNDNENLNVNDNLNPLPKQGGVGRVFTFEINDEQEPFTRKWIEESPWAEYVTFIIGDAKEKAKDLGVTFDMAFLDGDKRTYVEDYEAILP